jgi:hypothetical protein
MKGMEDHARGARSVPSLGTLNSCTLPWHG